MLLESCDTSVLSTIVNYLRYDHILRLLFSGCRPLIYKLLTGAVTSIWSDRVQFYDIRAPHQLLRAFTKLVSVDLAGRGDELFPRDLLAFLPTQLTHLTLRGSNDEKLFVENEESGRLMSVKERFPHLLFLALSCESQTAEDGFGLPDAFISELPPSLHTLDLMQNMTITSQASFTESVPCLTRLRLSGNSTWSSSFRLPSTITSLDLCISISTSTVSLLPVHVESLDIILDTHTGTIEDFVEGLMPTTLTSLTLWFNDPLSNSCFLLHLPPTLTYLRIPHIWNSTQPLEDRATHWKAMRKLSRLRTLFSHNEPSWVDLPPSLTSITYHGLPFAVPGIVSSPSSSSSSPPSGSIIGSQTFKEILPNLQSFKYTNTSNDVPLDSSILGTFPDCLHTLRLIPIQPPHPKDLRALPPSITFLDLCGRNTEKLLSYSFAHLPRSLLHFQTKFNIFLKPIQLKDLPPTLTSLEFPMDSSIDDECLSLLPRHLTRLELGGAKITDKGVQFLPRGILYLELHNSALTDAAVPHLPPSLTAALLYQAELTCACVPLLPKTLDELECKTADLRSAMLKF